MKSIVIVGLPGSGKTTLANKLANETGYTVLDDVSNKTSDIRQLLANHNTARGWIITDPWLCLTEIRKNAGAILGEYGEVQWLYYENNPEQCNQNIQVRKKTDSREIGNFVTWLANQYKPDDVTIPVFTPAKF